jgi:hypothetical protein
MGAIWTVRGYVLPSGISVIDEWMATAGDDAQAKFDSRLRILTQFQSARWKPEHAHHLKGKCDGLFAIRFESENVAYRPLCCFGPGRFTFTVVFFATEHNDKYRPPGACKTALERCAEKERDPLKAKIYDGYESEIPGEAEAPRIPQGVSSRFRH